MLAPEIWWENVDVVHAWFVGYGDKFYRLYDKMADYQQNCVMKRPQETIITGRHRRLCRTCMKCPLDRLLVQSESHRQVDAVGERLQEQPLT